MSSRSQAIAKEPDNVWRMPIVPEDYDRSPLTEKERRALELGAVRGFSSHSKEIITARNILARFNLPIADVFQLRHQGRSAGILPDAQRLLRREMHRHEKIFWDWSSAEWMDTLCPTPIIFRARHGYDSCVRVTITDAAYLLGGVTDLRPVGIGLNVSESANAYFGADLVAQQCKSVLDILVGKGYQNGEASLRHLRQGLSMLFILSRSPYLEDIAAKLLASVSEREEGTYKWNVYERITMALEELNILSSRPKEVLVVPKNFDSSGMAHEWYEWCMAWFERDVGLTPRLRQKYASLILVVGRWLNQHFPEIRTPEQWTEDLALRFRSDLCSWMNGQYASDKAKQIIEAKAQSGNPLRARGIASYLSVLSRYFTDLSRRPHAVGSSPARKIRLDFAPKEVFEHPAHVRRAIDRTAPRDIDLRVWARLAIAAATLSPSDLPQGARYPLSFYRALGLVWITSARRPNEIARLRLDCLREDWDPSMLDEDDHPVERLVPSGSDSQGTQGERDEKVPRIYYLHIPSGKTKGPFWIWIPDYVADAVKAWKLERPRNQKKLLDWKDHEYVDYLFCCRNTMVGPKFINRSLIPTLCAKAGVAVEDMKGKITGHRGRSTRLTLLRNNGVGLDDLAEYAGHANTRTIRRYVTQNLIQLHRIVKEADDLSRVIEGVVDVHAAAKGLPALRWFIGYDADGQPLYCANQVYHTCPHRLDCVRCGMFIGGEKARLLHEGENTLPIESKVPMSPVEKCVLDGDEAGAEACRAALQPIPAPETPDLTLIFNPEGLSNHELQKLAQLATVEALDKLRQALDAHEKRLAEVQQHKTGRNALIGAQKKRISLLEQLIVDCERSIDERQSGQA